jgi:hypothetical protein
MKHAAKNIYAYKSIGMHADAHLPSYPRNTDLNEDKVFQLVIIALGEII